MNTLVQKYIKAFNGHQGSDVEKIKAILEQYSDRWEWLAGDSMIADLLDDKTITADDMIDYLKGVLEYEGGNREFRNAVVAMETCLRREHQIVVDIDTAAFEAEAAEDDTDFDYVPGMDDVTERYASNY